MTWHRSLVTALRTLTVFPVPGKETDNFSRTLYWFPLAGLFLGALEALLGFVGRSFGWDELAAILVVLGGVAMTRGLHADGLADMTDGFFGGRDPEAALRIMKDPNVGSFGVLALVANMLLKWIGVVKLLHFQDYGAIVAGVMLARLVQVLLASLMPYARKTGGTADAFVNGAGWKQVSVASLSSVLLLVPLLNFNFVHGVVLLVAALFTAAATGLLSYRKIRGVTGDVLGAGSELTEAVVWIAGALLWTWIPS